MSERWGGCAKSLLPTRVNYLCHLDFGNFCTKQEVKFPALRSLGPFCIFVIVDVCGFLTLSKLGTVFASLKTNFEIRGLISDVGLDLYRLPGTMWPGAI